MKPPKQIFYKSVRSDGSSVWAPPGLGRVYEIGHTYRFPKWAPAWVWPKPVHDIQSWLNRPEPGGSSRVLICWGYMELLKLPFININEFDLPPSMWQGGVNFVLNWASTYFTIIGEVFVPASWNRDDGKSPKYCTKRFNPTRLLTPKWTTP